MKVSEMRVFIDESGNTGQNLLDSTQPVYVLASVHFAYEEAKAICDVLSTGKEKEIHFKKLKRSRSGKQRIKEFIQSPLLTHDRVNLFIAHKPFMVTTKIVDLLVETLYHQRGIDLYKEGANIAMSNLYYYATPPLCGEERFAKFQASFLQMIRNKDTTSIRNFYASIKELKDFCRDTQYKVMIDILSQTRGIIDDVLPHVNVTTLDPAVPLLFFLCGVWGEKLGTSFNLVCDESKPIAHDKNLIECLMDAHITATRIGYDSRKITLPLKVNTINFVNSKDVIQVQIADMVASACAYWARSIVYHNEEDDLFLAIKDSKIPNLIIYSIWPSHAVTPEELGTIGEDGINPVNHIAKLLRRKDKENK
ncbi:MAG: DUF3800 domain-containing protein [Candidatus Aminicenantes bacterium]|nr:DUF3800 domain-containing protein [Candidatus Aminicenantes bacterium]